MLPQGLCYMLGIQKWTRQAHLSGGSWSVAVIVMRITKCDEVHGLKCIKRSRVEHQRGWGLLMVWNIFFPDFVFSFIISISYFWCQVPYCPPLLTSVASPYSASLLFCIFPEKNKQAKTSSPLLQVPLCHGGEGVLWGLFWLYPF